jgi:alpha-1,3-glucosyltransferase
MAKALTVVPPTYDLSPSLAVAVVSLTVLLRVAVGYQPHSGQDNFHGLHSAYGGDFEAQRHWMELTWQLPIGEWYWYDLYYWGLDYPPLTAYVSWVCGALSSLLLGPESVELVRSRGLEDPVHKAYMRATVLVLDMALYGSVVWFVTRRYQQRYNTESVWSFGLAMAQPAILLIDHGHFQYNTTALGLALWSFYYMSRPAFINCVIGSVLYCMALSFKQMTLYYAPAVFFYLLGRCFADKGKYAAPRFVALGATVMVTFVSLWWPFVVYGPDDTAVLERLMHVIRRIIPLQRGLFEGKVSNIWCALSVKPVRIRNRIPANLQPLAALFLTLALAAPAAYKLFLTGRARRIDASVARSSSRSSGASDWTLLLWGTTASALAFFLASFQVHEKSLLLVLAPASLLLLDDGPFVIWFSILAAWTMWPLLVMDRLQTAYVCTILIFVALTKLRSVLCVVAATKPSQSFFANWLFRWIPAASYAVMLALHVAEATFTVPVHLPDLFPVLWSVVGCGFCCTAWLVTCWHLFGSNQQEQESRHKMS